MRYGSPGEVIADIAGWVVGRIGKLQATGDVQVQEARII